MLRSRYCPLCGGRLTSAIPPLDSRLRHVCGDCNFVLYMNPKVAAGTVPVRTDGSIALIRRAIEPGLGLWSWPCGYLEMDETVEQCAVRETEEECGLAVDLSQFLGIYTYPVTDAEGLAASTGLVVVAWRATAPDIEVTAGDDAAEAQWFRPDQIPWDDLAFDSSRRALRDHLDDRPDRVSETS